MKDTKNILNLVKNLSGKTSTTKISKSINTGDIVRVDLNPTLGSETRKVRYCLVLEHGMSPLDLMIAVPITGLTEKKKSRFFVQIPQYEKAGLIKPSVIDCYQIRTMSTNRLKTTPDGYYIFGTVGENILFQVRQRLAWLLDIDCEHLLTSLA